MLRNELSGQFLCQLCLHPYKNSDGLVIPWLVLKLWITQENETFT